MKTTFLILLLSFACYASADHLDVQPFKLLDTCTPQQYASIMDDFNDWGKAYSYQTELAVPLQSERRRIKKVVFMCCSPCHGLRVYAVFPADRHATPEDSDVIQSVLDHAPRSLLACFWPFVLAKGSVPSAFYGCGG